MSLLRIIGLCGVIGLSTCTICFVAADRLAQTRIAPAPTTFVAEAVPLNAPPEPEITGTVMQGPELPLGKPRAMGGFDTERLNALMRGEGLPVPAKKR